MKDPGATQGQPAEELAQAAETAQEETANAGTTEDTGGQPEAGE